jgi:hypothetical protein
MFEDILHLWVLYSCDEITDASHRDVLTEVTWARFTIGEYPSFSSLRRHAKPGLEPCESFDGVSDTWNRC